MPVQTGVGTDVSMIHSRTVSAFVVIVSVMTHHACALSASGREERLFKRRIRVEFCRPGQDSLEGGLHGYDELSVGGEPARRALLASAGNTGTATSAVTVDSVAPAVAIGSSWCLPCPRRNGHRDATPLPA